MRSRPGFEYVNAGIGLFIAVAGGQHHAFAHAELHLARCQVGDHHRQLSCQLRGIVGRLDASEDIARLGLADVQRQLQQLVRARHMVRLDDAGDAQVDPGEILDADGVGDRLDGMLLMLGMALLGMGFRLGGLQILFVAFDQSLDLLGSTRVIRC